MLFNVCQMLQRYCPIYLPLLPEPPTVAASPSSLQAEEALIDDWVRSAGGSWQQVAARCETFYGLPLCLELPPLSGPVEDFSARSGCPCLGGHSADTRFAFLLSPSDVYRCEPLFEESTRFGLLRPSTFAAARSNPLPAPAVANTPATQHSAAVDPQSLAGFLDPLLELEPSDWHLEAQRDAYRSRLRIDGQLRAEQSLPRPHALRLIAAAKAAANLPTDTNQRPLDGHIQLRSPPTQLRVALIPSLHGESMVCRFLPGANAPLPRMDSLGMPADVTAQWLASLEKPAGLWLVAGPTGSGKTTTLHASLAARIDRREKILSIEDPVERRIPGVCQVNAANRTAWQRSLRAFLRQAPDTILIGELRDADSTAIARTAALSGHRILASFHASSPATLFARLRDLAFGPELIPLLVQSVLFQRLLPKLCPHCRIPTPPPASLLALTDALPVRPQNPLTAEANPKGCPNCHFTGFTGRRPLFALAKPEPQSNDLPLKAPALKACLAGELPLSIFAQLFPSLFS